MSNSMSVSSTLVARVKAICPSSFTSEPLESMVPRPPQPQAKVVTIAVDAIIRQYRPFLLAIVIPSYNAHVTPTLPDGDEFRMTPLRDSAADNLTAPTATLA